MKKSSVYFIESDTSDIDKRALALKKLLGAVSPFSLYKKDEVIPVKLTIGDSPCVYNVNPELVKVAISEIKKKSAKPFIFDTSVIYKGERQNAVDHLNLVQSKGFGHSRVGAPFIIADGVFGQDGNEFSVSGENIDRIKAPSFVGMLESLLVLSHPTGHIVAGYGGAIKNVAMGMSCRPTKQAQHSSLKPSIIAKKCVACGCCVDICPARAISIIEEKASINQQLCIGCGECICACKFDAITINWHEDPHVFSKRMAEVAGFILAKFKNKYFINFAFDITKECDCLSTKDEEIISRNLGILASEDILALDKATMDMILQNKKPGAKRLGDAYETLFERAQELGIGNPEYNLITL